MTTVYIGKLAPETKKSDITDFVSSVGTVKHITMKRPRFRREHRVLFCFVEFETEEQRNKAVAELNGKELAGVQVSVEVALPKPKREPAPAAAAPAAAAAAAPTATPTATATPATPAAPAADAAAGAAAGENKTDDAAAGERRRRRRRGTRARRPRVETPISKNVAYVGNLPFVVDEEGMKDIFEGCAFIEARVIRYRSGHSRGFGFVTFNNEEDRAEAIKVTDGSVVEGRRITVSPAHERPERPEDAAPAAGAAPAATTATPVQNDDAAATNKPAAQ